jgi:uncharacterized heparinase superfamily protein
VSPIAVRRASLARLGRTLVHLQPGQFLHRGRLRVQRLALARCPGVFASRWSAGTPSTYGWPTSFRPLDAIAPPLPISPLAVGRGDFAFIGEQHNVNGPGGWRPQDRSQLFRYNLHYFEWAWLFLAHDDTQWARAAFGDAWSAWQYGTTFGLWDEWSPYVVSLRAWSLCGVFDGLIRGSPVESAMVTSLHLHAGFLKANLELDVGGNHLIKNLKALVGLGVFFGDKQQIDHALALLGRQLKRQVLADGGHFERSPSYHAQVLGDVIDIAALLAAAGQPHAELTEVIERMRQWLAEMLLPNGEIPLFGDSAPIAPARLAALRLPAPPTDRLAVLAESGYIVARPRPGTTLIADVGAPCPDELPAHGQAGCLSFVLAVDGDLVLTDTGTSTYVGERRAFERSTAAHSTVEVDGQDQSEVWGSFRVGRRARPTIHGATDDGATIVIDASHDGYRHLPGSPTHRRHWTLSAESMHISDRIEGEGHHSCVARWVSTPQAHATADLLSTSGSVGAFATATATIATAFGQTEATVVGTYTTSGQLPLTIDTTLSFAAVAASVGLAPAIGEL